MSDDIDSGAGDGPAGQALDDAGGEARPSRRGVLGILGLAGLAAAAPATSARRSAEPLAQVGPPKRNVDAALAAHVKTIVVIYAENRSFNNLFGDFPGLAEPLAAVSTERALQRDRDGGAMARLPAIWGGLVPDEQVVEHRSVRIGEADLPPLANAPFALATPAGDPLPQGLVTRDLIHAFYHNQMQINGGRNDMFAAWSDAGGMVMGRYGDASASLRLWRLAREFTLCDNFFMGAFGGSFLNHQYLIAARPPFYPGADKSSARVLIAELEGGDPKGARLKPIDSSPVSAIVGPPRFGPSSLTPDFWAVNTMGPPYAPSMSFDPLHPEIADVKDLLTMPPQDHATIGDRLSDRGVDWAWYAGGWAAALAGAGNRQTVRDSSADFSVRPNFQPHHQPFNYFRSLAPGTKARDARLRDAGVDGSARTNRFLADAAKGALPPVTFYKPQGDLNMHAGYSDVDAGDRHIAQAIDALQKSPQWPNMVIVITFDENGGWWDHVAPPKGDRWGPGTRIPALVVSPFAKAGQVDHTIYDTGSIARLIVRRFGLETLPGLVERDAAMIAAGGPPPGDLTNALELG